VDWRNQWSKVSPSSSELFWSFLCDLILYIPSFSSREAIAPRDGNMGKLYAQCLLSPLTFSSRCGQAAVKEHIAGHSLSCWCCCPATHLHTPLYSHDYYNNTSCVGSVVAIAAMAATLFRPEICLVPRLWEAWRWGLSYIHTIIMLSINTDHICMICKRLQSLWNSIWSISANWLKS